MITCTLPLRTELLINTLPKDRTLDIRETPDFMEIANRVRQGLREGHWYED